MKNFNRDNKNKKYSRMGLSFLYIFLLSLTSFHHHNIDVSESENIFQAIPNSDTHFSFASEECPITNFSRNGFNSYAISVSSVEPIIEILDQYFSYKDDNSRTNFINSYTLRGPPTPKFI